MPPLRTHWRIQAIEASSAATLRPAFMPRRTLQCQLCVDSGEVELPECRGCGVQYEAWKEVGSVDGMVIGDGGQGTLGDDVGRAGK